MDLSFEDINKIILKFFKNSSLEEYNNINKWYERNIQIYPNNEFLKSVYLFLVGANLNKKYYEISYEEHCAQIKEITSLLQIDNNINKIRRKTFFDYGRKAL